MGIYYESENLESEIYFKQYAIKNVFAIFDFYKSCSTIKNNYH